MTDWDASTLATAIAGLRDRAEELKDYPDRLHEFADNVQPADLLGSPRIHPDFWRWLLAGVHVKDEAREEITCPELHDDRAVQRDHERTCGEIASGGCPRWREHLERTLCLRCGGVGTYVTTRDVYARPLARALVQLSQAKSGIKPHPIIIIIALLAERFSVEMTARRYGVIIMSSDQRKTEEARILGAIRALRMRYEESIIPPRVGRPGWLERSDSQRSAEDVA